MQLSDYRTKRAIHYIDQCVVNHLRMVYIMRG